MDEEQRRREMDFLSFEIGEIREAELKAGEDDELESQYRLLLNSQKIQEGLNAAYRPQAVNGSERGTIGRALRELNRIGEFDERLSGLNDMLADIDSLLNDFNRELSGCMEDFAYSERIFIRWKKGWI